LINEELILNLVEDMDKILYTFEKDGKFAMLSSIRNELFQEANASLKQVKAALAQPAQEPVAWMDVCEKGQMSNLRYWSEPDNRHEVALYAAQPAAQPAQEPVFDWLPETTTHINQLVVNVQSGGKLVTRFNAFKYEDGLLMVYHTDNENEYPEWIVASRQFKHTNFPVFSIASPLAQPAQEPVAQNFCPRCGKRTPDLTTIHTCTPPRGLEMT
jgi:hypothetical protein